EKPPVLRGGTGSSNPSSSSSESATNGVAAASHPSRPIPLPPPVTTAVLPANSVMCVLPCVLGRSRYGPGLGKSRLVEGLREAAGKDRIWVAIRCSPFHTASAFHPIIEHLKRVLGWQPEDTAPQHLAKLEAGLAGFKTLPLAESVR